MAEELPSVQGLTLASNPAPGATAATVASAGAPAEPADAANADQSIDPFEVRGAVVNGQVQAIDYNKLIEQFGTRKISPELLEKFERVTGRKPHRLLRRGMFFSHRDLEGILDRYEKGKPFFLYTGRGPSSDSMHLGHLIPFMFTKYALLPSNHFLSAACNF